MRFIPFPRMPCHGDSDSSTWVALEKIHGSHLAVGVTRDEIQVGNKKRWMGDDELFFGWKLLRAYLQSAGRRVFEAVCAPDAQVMLYGELFGGEYPHPDVRRIEAFQAVQTGIFYAPDLRWALFEVLIATGDEARFLSYSDTAVLAKKAGIFMPPCVAHGNKTKVLDFPIRFPSKVATNLGFPTIRDNLAEGYVTKPDIAMEIDRYTAVKKKREEMDERRFDGGVPWDPWKILPAETLWDIAAGLVNRPRLDSAASKVGREDASQVVQETVLDVLIDLEEVFPAAMRALDEGARQSLELRIGDRARRFLTEEERVR